MVKIPTKDMVKGLKKKGFRHTLKGRQPHEKLRLYVGEKKTAVSVPISRSSKIKEYGSDLISVVKRELQLDTNRQVVDLVDCSLTYEKYIEILLEKGMKIS